jgi:hypothetical protein
MVAGIMERLQELQNSHDAAGMAALFSPDYQSVQPAHPNRGFGGSQQVLKNWTSVFEGIPDFHATLVASVTEGQAEWGEWDWRGTYLDGSPFLERGVIIMIVLDGLIRAARLYMEPVESGGGDIDAVVQELFRPPPKA